MHERLHLPAGLDGALWHFRWRGRFHPRHTHDELELNIVLRGTAAYLVGDRRCQLARASILWLHPAQEHVLVEASPDFAMWICVFTVPLIARARGDAYPEIAEADPRALRHRTLALPWLRRLDATCEELFAADEPPLANAGLAWLLLSAWSAFRRADELPVSQPVHPAVERAVHLLRRGDDAGGLAALARRSGLSPQRLSRLFKAQMGIALAEYRNRQRLDRALGAIAAGEPLAGAAIGAGFGSYAQFHRVCLRLAGGTPGRLLRDLRGQAP